MPVMALSQFKEICLITGNLIYSKRLKNNPKLTQQNEIIESMICTIQSALDASVGEASSDSTSVIVHNSLHPENVLDRDSLKITLKLFLFDVSVAAIEEAISIWKNNIKVDDMELLLLAFAPDSKCEDIKAVWQRAEQFSDDDTVSTLGVSDMELNRLQAIYSWARVKPSVNQIHPCATTDCIDPAPILTPELEKYCHDNEIALNSHSDQAMDELISPNTLEGIFSGIKSEYGLKADDWKPSFLIRYSAMHRNRNIVRNKGYVLKLKRN